MMFYQLKHGFSHLLHQYRNRLLTFGIFTGLYMSTLRYTKHSPSEYIRMGMAGSLASITVDSLCHIVDTVNVRAKVCNQHLTSSQMIHKIYTQEGISGFSKGYSAIYYGTITSTFIYFSLYKWFKQLS